MTSAKSMEPLSHGKLFRIREAEDRVRMARLCAIREARVSEIGKTEITPTTS